jgi:hypothetical protein
MRRSAVVSLLSISVRVLALAIVFPSFAGQAKKARPPKPEELVGAWIGYWEDGEFTRLELRADSTGFCAFVAPADSATHDYGVQVYRITRWSLDGWSLVITLTPTESRLENVYFKGRVHLDALDLEVGGVDRKWKEKLVLNEESRMQTSNLETKSKIEEKQRESESTQ